MRKSEAKTVWTTLPNKVCVGSFRNGLVHKPVSVQDGMKKYQKPQPPWINNEKLKNIPAWDVKKAR